MANWANPTITTQYDVFVNESKDRDVDAITMILNSGSIATPPVGSIKLLRQGSGLVKLQEWDSTLAFLDRVISVDGGGTGSATAAGARTNLGLGTMALQGSGAVAITGGTIANLTALSLSTSIVFTAGASYDLGTNIGRCRRGYFSDALLLPVGTDKYATS